jgi:hypothetical protein
MSKKFSILITVSDSGSASAKAYGTEEAQKAIEDFNKARDNGKEAYLYYKPMADKRSKSEAAQQATQDGLNGGNK